MCTESSGLSLKKKRVSMLTGLKGLREYKLDSNPLQDYISDERKEHMEKPCDTE